jgi:hypothetical protein
VFTLSQDYPATKPSPNTLPWKTINFKTKPAEYLGAVLQYCYEGNIDVDWAGQNNAVRKWYHAPWLDKGNKGREFIHGMTRERTTPALRLHPNQTSQFGAYAVGLYNPMGGYTIGQVWQDHNNPDPSKAIFPEGSVACKLIFTQATAAQVPYLSGAFEWQANAGASFTATQRSPQALRLLQIDVAVKDSRAATTTGWVFGTFNYNGNATGTRPWDKMVPVGLMWGNDATLTPVEIPREQAADAVDCHQRERHGQSGHRVEGRRLAGAPQRPDRQPGVGVPELPHDGSIAGPVSHVRVYPPVLRGAGDGPARPGDGTAQDEMVPEHQAEAVRYGQRVAGLQPATLRRHRELLRLHGLRHSVAAGGRSSCPRSRQNMQPRALNHRVLPDECPYHRGTRTTSASIHDVLSLCV